MYKDRMINRYLRHRVISESKASDEITWHRDANHRVVTVIEGKGWSFQRDNQIPFSISPGDTIKVRAGEWHRVIPGSGNLELMIKEIAVRADKGDDEDDEDLLIDLIKEMTEEKSLDIDDDTPVDIVQTDSVEPHEEDLMATEGSVVEALLFLRESKKKKSDHEPGYKAPEGSARDRSLDAAKAAYKRGDVAAAIQIRDKMEKQARNKPDFKPRKSKYTDETKQPDDYPPVMSEYDEMDDMDEEKMCEGLNAKTREALKKKAETSRAPLGALATVYRKGLGAFYSSGSRPGMTSHQWAMARVNSFLKGGKARQVDAAQWKQVQKFRKKKRR